MSDRSLWRFRDLVRAGHFIVTVHAVEEMDDDGLGISDIEECVLSGRIFARQRDRRSREWRFLIVGQTPAGKEAVVVVKIGATGKLVFITTYIV